VKDENVRVMHVPGSFEVPYAVQKLLSGNPKPDTVIALGCIIKGETDHDKYLAATVTDALMRLSLDFKTPVASGIITANTLDQAVARTKGQMNRGREATVAALTSALL
jgi:6,7-dimethyl-8-ribityllumazine synthase